MTQYSNDIDKLDKKLKQIEERFYIELEQYLLRLESNTTRQSSNYKKDKQILVPTSKTLGLEKLLKSHFKNVENISSGYARKNLIDLYPGDKENIKKLYPSKTNKNNLIYAQQLAKKEIEDYKRIIQDRLNNTLKLKDLNTSEIKEIIKLETSKFKNIRLNAISSTESIRVANETRIDIVEKSKLQTNLKLVVTIDDRTTEHICKPRDRIIVSLDFIKLNKKELVPALHVNCRTFLEATKEPITSINKVKDIIKMYPSWTASPSKGKR